MPNIPHLRLQQLEAQETERARADLECVRQLVEQLSPDDRRQEPGAEAAAQELARKKSSAELREHAIASAGQLQGLAHAVAHFARADWHAPEHVVAGRYTILRPMLQRYYAIAGWLKIVQAEVKRREAEITPPTVEDFEVCDG